MDGLPLAIELAAARVKVLPPSALLARLDTRLPLLRAAPVMLRHDSARCATRSLGVITCLVPEERVLFRRLGVFAGGWTFEAAEAVANTDGTMTLVRSTSLVDKSLVRQSDQAADEPRFTMLETIREFAVEHLRGHAEDEAAVRRAHAAFFADVALGDSRSAQCRCASAIQAFSG